MEQALVRFGRFVNDMEGGGKGDNYIQLAKFLLDCRKDGTEYDQSHLPVVQQYEAVGHAVRAVYTYSGMADVAVETHDVDYQSAVMSLWDNIVNRKYYVTGGIGSGETSEGFGPNYSLRNNAYCESCSSCGVIFFQYKMNLAYHDAKYADLYEETLYNALLGSIDLEGKNFYYDNPLDANAPRYAVARLPVLRRQHPADPADAPHLDVCQERRRHLRQPVHRQHDQRWRMWPAPTSQMVQATDYPWSGKVSITVNPKAPKTFSVRIRVPNRDVSEPLREHAGCERHHVALGQRRRPSSPTIEKGYAVITRDWKAGDKIELVLPMKVQRVKASEKIAADQRPRGPALRPADLQHREGRPGHHAGPRPRRRR